jgi:DNA repair exonuclease SbcCD nuclease subunit
MRLLLFSDLHLDSPFTWAGPELGRQRRLALRAVLRTITELVAELKVDALVCAGDLYEHERFTPDTARFVSETLNAVEVPVLLAPGNHDWLGPESLYATAGFAEHVHVFSEAELTPVELTDGFTIWGAAHRAPAHTDGFLQSFMVDRGGVNIGLFHGSELGAMTWQETSKVPHAPFTATQIAQAGLDHALVGHFHTPRHEHDYTYPGNPDPLTFGETGQRGAVLVTIADAGGVTRETFPVAQTVLDDLRVDVTGCEHAGAVGDRVTEALAWRTGIVRLTLEGELGQDVDLRLSDLAVLGSHLPGFLPRVGDLHVAFDLATLGAEQTVRGEFVRTVTSDPDLDDSQRHRILTAGLRALAGRSDLEV